MGQTRETRIRRLLANRRRRLCLVLAFVVLAVVVGLTVERTLRQEGISLTDANEVQSTIYDEGTSAVLEHTVAPAEGPPATVTVDAAAENGVPQDARLEVTEIEPTSNEWKEYRKQASAFVDPGTVVLARFFDISIVSDGREIQPDGSVSVSIDLADEAADIPGARASVVHFADGPEAVAATASGGTTSFEAQGFSVYGVLYTVDFAHGGFSYKLPGGGETLLSELLASLEIPAGIGDVVSVSCSNPDVLSVRKAGPGTIIRRIIPDTSGDADATLVPEKTVAGVVEEALPDPWTNVEVAEGDYVLRSLASFDTNETLLVCTPDNAYAIAMTDPLDPSEIARNADGSWNLTDVATVSAAYDSSYTTTSQERDATLSFEFAYHIGREMMDELRRNYDPDSGMNGDYPTFVYDLSGTLAASDLANSINASTTYLTANRKRVARLVTEESGKVTLTITDINWFLGRTSIDGTFTTDLSLDANKASNHGNTVIAFPGVEIQIPITYKTNIGPASKTVNVVEPANEGDPYRLEYQLSLKTTDALNALVLTDTIGGKQQFDASSVKVNGNSVSVSPTSDGFTYDYGPAQAGTELTVTYATTISAEDYASMSPGQSSWETNRAMWTYNGDQPLDGGSTSHEVKKPPLDPPTITKTSSAQGQEVGPGDTINYTLVVEGQQLAGITVFDSMTDLQYVLGSPAAKVTVDGVDRPDLAQNMFASYNKDDYYSSNSTSVINYTFPEGFEGRNVTITYSTKVIDQDTAGGASVYGQQSISNTFSENQSWQQQSTTSTVQYEKEVETAVNKSASLADGTITYTIVIGDGTTTLDGVKVKDVMSGNQQWDASSFAMSGNNVPVPNWAPTSTNQVASWGQTAFSFAFPAGTGKGPVTITYRAAPLESATAMASGIYGTQSLVNTVDAGTGHDATAITYEYEEEPKFAVTKTASAADDLGPDGEVTYQLSFGDANTVVDGTLRIMDEMTDLQKLDGDVTVTVPGAADGTYTLWNGANVEVRDGSFIMPTASNGWDTTGVTWGYFDDGAYNTYTVRVFCFQFPDLKDGAGNPVKGPVGVTYRTRIISADEAATANVTGTQSVYNTATSGNGSATTEVTPTFPSNLSHVPALSKRFLSWDDDGYTTWWGIRIEADASDSDNRSTYPLTDLTLTEDITGGGVYYSTEYPVQNYVRNELGDLDLLGAVISTDSGTVLQAGRDYTINKQTGAIHFPELNEAVTVRLAIHNPDATINSFYQHNRVSLTYKKDAYNIGTLTAEADQKRVKQDVDLTKRGDYDETTKTTTWTVIFNPYTKESNDPDWAKVRFEDTLPEGMEYVEGTFKVAISGSHWAESTPTPTIEDNGTKLVVDDISLHQMWGASIDDANGVGTGLNGTCYAVTYQTRLSDTAWDQITSSLTGSQTFTNAVTMSDGGSTGFSANGHVEVGSSSYLSKEDITPVAADGHVYSIDDDDQPITGANGSQLMYGIDVNPEENTLNMGKTLTLLDRIDTSMELDSDTIKIYTYAGGVERQMSTNDVNDEGITISYNDNVRYLTIAGLKDRKHYRVTYRTTVRAVGTSTYANMATLVGGGSHSVSVSQQHTIAKDNAGISGETGVYITVKKIDENNITATLPGAQFELYKCVLATDVSGFDYADGDWRHLLEDVRSGDPAILADIAQKYKIVGAEKVEGKSYAGSIAASTSESAQSSVTGEEGLLTFVDLEEHTLYYWVESGVPAGYAADQTPHYFTMYVNEDEDKIAEGQTILASAEERKDAAKALDNATQIANGITVAAMSADTTWNVTNVDKKYTSVTATKVWEGDYDNEYETRPAGGIQLDLYRIDASGNETLVEDRSPVPINADTDGSWPSFTWYHLDPTYSYTVRERPVKGYLTSYSDEGKGVGNGTITVTNTFVPKYTEVYVQKRWDPAEGAKPDQVMVKLYQIAHVAQADGTVAAQAPAYTGEQLALTAGNGWKDGWSGLPTTDENGNVLTYTVVEDVDAVKKATGTLYGAVYSDDGNGVVSASANDPIVITNVKDAPGSLKITKRVTVNGEGVSDSAADGTYRFRITDENGNAATHQDGSEVGDVQVRVTDGRVASAMVDGLSEGVYYVYEYAPTNGAGLVGNNGIRLEVKAGVTRDGSAPEATFVNNVDKRRVRVDKTWLNANGTNAWPSGVETQVQLMADGVAVGEPVTLSATQESYLWDDLEEDKTYSVQEVGANDQGVVTLSDAGGKQADYKVTSSTTASSNGLGTVVTLTNTELTDVVFVKEWGVTGKETWPTDAQIKVQLLKDGVAMGDPVTLTSADANDARDALGGYTYAWHDLEAGHAYSVTEASNDAFLQQQLGDLRVRNIGQKTSVTVRKVWADDNTPGDAWTVTGTVSRKMRAYGTTEADWTNDPSFGQSFQITNASSDATVVMGGLDAFSQVDGVLYEYAYDVREDVPTGYVGTKSGSGTADDPYVLTNTAAPDSAAVIKMNKVFKDDAGNVLGEDDIPADAAPTFTLKRYKTTASSGAGDSGGAQPTGETTTVTLQAKDGYVFDQIEARVGQLVQIDVYIENYWLLSNWNYTTNYIGDSTEWTRMSFTDEGDHNAGTWASTTSLTVTSNLIITLGPVHTAYNRTGGVGLPDDETRQPKLKIVGSSPHGPTTEPDNSFAGDSKTYPQDGTWITDGENTYWQADFGAVPLVGDNDVTYSYYVEESNVPAGCSVSYSPDEATRLSQSGTVTVTNTIPLTSVTVNKLWRDRSGNDTKADHAADTATIQLYKARSAEGQAPAVSQEAGTNLVLPNERETVGDPVAIGSADDWTHTWSSLPRYETVEGTTYGLTYYVEELATTAEGTSVSYDYTFNSAGVQASGISSANITNTEDGSTSVMVNKNWTDGNANHGEDSATFELYRVATIPGALSVTVPNPQTSEGSITVKVSDGTSEEEHVLSANNNWTISKASLDGDKTYTVSVVGFDTNVFESVAVQGSASVSGSQGGIVALSATLKTSLTITVPSKPSKTSKIVVSVNDGTTDTDYELASPDWTQAIAGLDHGKTYTVSIKSFNADDFSNVVIDGASSTGQYVINGSVGGAVSIIATEKASAQDVTVRLFYQDSTTALDSISCSTGDTITVSYTIKSNQNMYYYLHVGSKDNIYGFGGWQNSGSAVFVATLKIESDRVTYLEKGNAVNFPDSTKDIYIQINSDKAAEDFETPPHFIKNVMALQSSLTASSSPIMRKLGAQATTQTDITLGESAQHNLQLPAGATRLDDKTVTLNRDDLQGEWTYTWKNLPSSEVVGGVTYNYAYFVKEASTTTSAESIDATYSYVYNAASAPSSGVRVATVSNKPTYTGGLKIRKTFSGLPAGTDTSNLMFRITAPDGTTQDVSYADFTNGEYVIAESGLPVDDVYTVTELNAASLVEGYTLVAGQSATSASGRVPSQDVGEIELTNTYVPIKGAITVTKNVTLNGSQEYDDVAAGQRVTVGLEKLVNGMWLTVTDPADSTKPMVRTITVGTGSTGSATFGDLELGTYRAYELSDDGTRVVAQDEVAGKEVNGYAWQVTQSGTYYTLSGSERVEHEGDVGHGVILSAGTEDDKAPRNAEVTVTNNKTETGSIKVNKALLYNGAADTTKNGSTIRFGLYNATPPTSEGKVDEVTVTIGDAGEDGKGIATFDDLAFGTYYVYELDSNGQPVTGSSAIFFAGVPSYVVSGNNKAQVLDHTNKDVTLSFTNSLLEKGSIEVTKRVRTAADTADTSASGSTFTVGLFTKDGDEYKPVAGRTQTVTVGTNGEGSATFQNLDFAAGAEGTTYYVFEVDADGNRLDANATSNGYRVTYANAGIHGFMLTQAQHDFAGDGGATVANTAVPVDLRIAKVDKLDTSTKLPGAVFALRQIDESDAEKVSYKQGGIQKESPATNADGETLISGISNGFYEVTETAAPTGYVLTGGRTFYFKVANGTVTFLKAEVGKAPSAWSATLQSTADSNVLSYVPPSTSGDVQTPATVTVGNNKGNVLPSSGGPGTYAMVVCGGLLLCVAVVLAFRQRRA